MKKIIAISFLLTFFCFGCAIMPTQEQIASLDYGMSLSIDYEQAIKEWFDNLLFDPYSAVYEFDAPQQYWYKAPPLLGGGLYAGYMVYVKVNAKNRMGGYTGKEKYGFLFKNNSILKVLSPGELSLMRNQ